MMDEQKPILKRKVTWAGGNPKNRFLNCLAEDVKILDCAHPFGDAKVGDRMIVLRFPNNWLQVTFDDVEQECEKCKRTFLRHQVLANVIGFCPICGIVLNADAPVRNYIIGQRPAVDTLLRKVGVIPVENGVAPGDRPALIPVLGNPLAMSAGPARP